MRRNDEREQSSESIGLASSCTPPQHMPDWWVTQQQASMIHPSRMLMSSICHSSLSRDFDQPLGRCRMHGVPVSYTCPALGSRGSPRQEKRNILELYSLAQFSRRDSGVGLLGIWDRRRSPLHVRVRRFVRDCSDLPRQFRPCAPSLGPS